MNYSRYHAPRHVAAFYTILYSLNYFIVAILPDIIAGLGFAALIILLPILAAFVV